MAQGGVGDCGSLEGNQGSYLAYTMTLRLYRYLLWVGFRREDQVLEMKTEEVPSVPHHLMDSERSGRSSLVEVERGYSN